MAHTITVEVPQDIYNSLLAAAQETGETPEQVAVQWLAQATKFDYDPLDDIVGAISSDIPDWGERHDYYIGQGIMEYLCALPQWRITQRLPDLFVETAGWAEIIDNKQSQHLAATALYQTARQRRRRFITTNYVLAELIALLTRPMRLPRSQIVMVVGRLRTSPHVEIIYVDPILDELAWQLLAARQDKVWSLADCVSFVVMQQRGITEALTTDHHFEQAGFVSLLKP